MGEVLANSCMLPTAKPDPQSNLVWAICRGVLATQRPREVRLDTAAVPAAKHRLPDRSEDRRLRASRTVLNVAYGPWPGPLRLRPTRIRPKSLGQRRPQLRSFLVVHSP